MEKTLENSSSKGKVIALMLCVEIRCQFGLQMIVLKSNGKEHKQKEWEGRTDFTTEQKINAMKSTTDKCKAGNRQYVCQIWN